jgi:hypothetical protein
MIQGRSLVSVIQLLQIFLILNGTQWFITVDTKSLYRILSEFIYGFFVRATKLNLT